MKRVEIEADQMPGQDSFLDVITNIVGILILLVLVAGLRTSRAVHEASSDDAAAQSDHHDEMREVYTAARNSEKTARELVHRVADVRHETAFRESEREWLTMAVAEAEQEIATRRTGLGTDDRRDFDLRRDLADAQAKLDDLAREQIALLSRDEASEEIQCEPTPLGKVVTGKQVHLLLSEDHVAVVPFDDLMELVKDDVKENIWRLRQQDEMERTVGPVNGFRLRYWFVKAEVRARTESGAVMTGSIPQFSHCYFVPIAEPPGEPAEDAMRGDSELHHYLRRLRPDGTTVTVWTYPGNYDRLRELKRSIRELGFQIAVRPLPKGMPIGASQRGSESISE
jgi:hypothetical protein